MQNVNLQNITNKSHAMILVILNKGFPKKIVFK